MAGQPEDSSISARLEQLERAVGILSAYIVERDQLRTTGVDADIVRVAKKFYQPR
jgi:hypothetical protein